MQPHIASTAYFVFLIFLRCLAAQVSPRNTLYQGDTIFNSTSQLVSANRLFTLGFHTPENTNNTYLAVWYTNISFSPSPAWIGNRDTPVDRNSNPILTIDEAGNLIINHTGGEPVPVYSSSGGMVMMRNNVSATLLDSGNFVVSEMGSSILWESFDYPTDTLLPGMKLGLNHRTGRNWTLSSWFNETNPDTGAFTMEWDPIVGSLLIRRRGVIYWTSGQMKDYHIESGDLRVKEFENMNAPDVFNLNYNFTNVTNGDEEYFTYTLLNDPNWTPDDRKVISGWRLDYNGDIRDTRAGSISFTLAQVSECYGYKPKGSDIILSGCEMWEQPTCRNERQTFVFRAGYFTFSGVNAAESLYDRDSSLGPSDCREICWDDCLCVGYSLDFVSEGCMRWRGRNAEFVQSLDGVTNANRIYVLQTAPSGKGMRKHVKIILGVVSAIVVLVSGLALFFVRKLRKGFSRQGRI